MLVMTAIHCVHLARRPQYMFLSFQWLLMWNKTELIDINGSQDIYLREQTPPYFSRRGSHQRVEWRGRGEAIGRYLEYIKYTYTQ
jgi:hypothetical protein